MSDAPSSSPDSHWCYHCNKRVSVETLDEVIVCYECNKGFVESIQAIPTAYSSPAPPPPLSPDLTDEGSSIGSHFLQMLRLLAHAPSQRSPSQLDLLSYEDDLFRLELNTENEDDDEEEDDSNEDEEDEEEEDQSRINLQEIFPRSRTGRNRILDWAEILMGIEDNSIESDRYTGNPADYIDDTTGYEALLQNLAEGDDIGGGGRRGAPPAAKSVIETLENFKVSSSELMIMVCAVCKDTIMKGEIGKKLPCGHCYHENCIVPWLETRNSCPVCRFQLKTDDAEYEEEERKKRVILTGSASSSSSTSHL